MPRTRREYEDEVRSFIGFVAELRRRGWQDEQLAARLCWYRNQAKRWYREGLPATVLDAIEARNFTRYGDPLGPDHHVQFARYGSWIEVIEAACRPAKIKSLEDFASDLI